MKARVAVTLLRVVGLIALGWGTGVEVYKYTRYARAESQAIVAWLILLAFMSLMVSMIVERVWGGDSQGT